MELTQLQGQSIGQKFTPISGKINIGSASGNQIQNSGLPSNAAQIHVENGSAEIQQMHPSSPVFVNGEQIQKKSPVNYGDTVSVGTGNNVVLGAHPQGQNLNAQQVGEHLGNLNFSGEQIADLTNKIFDFHGNQAIHKKTFFLIGILSVLLVGIVFSFSQLMGVSEKIEKEKKILDKKLIEINNQLETASLILGSDLTDTGNIEESECEPGVEGCETGNNPESLFAQLKSLEKNVSTLQKEQKNAIAEMKKVAENPKEKISEAGDEKLSELKNISLENQDNISLINENFSKIIKNIQEDIDDFSEFKGSIKTDLKDFEKISDSFNSDKNVLSEENQIRDNKIKESQSDVSDLEKKDDKIDIELKKLQEEINSLELKIKNL